MHLSYRPTATMCVGGCRISYRIVSDRLNHSSHITLIRNTVRVENSIS